MAVLVRCDCGGGVVIDSCHILLEKELTVASKPTAQLGYLVKQILNYCSGFYLEEAFILWDLTGF